MHRLPVHQALAPAELPVSLPQPGSLSVVTVTPSQMPLAPRGEGRLAQPWAWRAPWVPRPWRAGTRAQGFQGGWRDLLRRAVFPPLLWGSSLGVPQGKEAPNKWVRCWQGQCLSKPIPGPGPPGTPGDPSRLTEGSIRGCPEHTRHVPSLRGRAVPAGGASPVHTSFSGRPPLTSYPKTPFPCSVFSQDFLNCTSSPQQLTPFASLLSAPPTGVTFS